MANLRLDKYLADMQLGTRSQVKEYIRKGRIRINGEVIKSPDTKIDTQAMEVSFDGNLISYVEMEYYMLHKPAGVLSATMDKKAETVVDLIKEKNRKDLFPVGRLDKDTEGLLLITNDGALAHELLSPKKHVDKLYFATVLGTMTQHEVKAFQDGLQIHEDFKALPAKLLIDQTYTSEGNAYSDVYVTIQEGKFHQIKKMFEAVGSEVTYLKRLSMGPLQLDEHLQIGDYRKLTEDELSALKQCCKH